MAPQESLVNGGGAFKAGPLGICQVCHNKAELGAYDGRNVCGDCFEVLEHGRQQNIKSGKIQQDAPEQVPEKGYPQALRIDRWVNTSQAERDRYLGIIESAPEKVIEEVISKLVNSRVLHLDFHKIIQNERWFSVIDLRRIAESVDSSALAPNKEVIVKPRRKKPCGKTSLTLKRAFASTPREKVPAEGQAFQLPQHPENQQNQQLELPLSLT